jgi:hypothetical protein
VESAVNQVVSKRFVKKQQTRWTPAGAHFLLQIRIEVLNGDWRATPELERLQADTPPFMPSAYVTCSGTVTTRGLTQACSTWPISPASSATLGGPAFEEKTTRLVALCEELQTYIWNNPTAIRDYGQRRREGKAISTADAEGTVNQLVNARLNRAGQMRWSAQGAHRVLQVRAAVLDGHLHAETFPAAA